MIYKLYLYFIYVDFIPDNAMNYQFVYLTNHKSFLIHVNLYRNIIVNKGLDVKTQVARMNLSQFDTVAHLTLANLFLIHIVVAKLIYNSNCLLYKRTVCGKREFLAWYLM